MVQKWMTIAQVSAAFLVGSVSLAAGSESKVESQNRRWLMPGAFCLPESDEDDINIEGSFYRVRTGYDLVCPFLWLTTIDRYQESPALREESGFQANHITTNSRVRVTVVDNSSGSNAFASVCRQDANNIGFICSFSVTSASCGTGVVCTLSDLFPSDVNGPAEDLYHLQITLPNDGSRIIRYEARLNP